MTMTTMATNTTTEATLSSTSMPTMIMTTPSPWNRLQNLWDDWDEEKCGKKTNENIRILGFHLFVGNITNAYQNFKRVGKVVCACVFFSPTLAFIHSRMSMMWHESCGTLNKRKRTHYICYRLLFMRIWSKMIFTRQLQCHKCMLYHLLFYSVCLK